MIASLDAARQRFASLIESGLEDALAHSLRDTHLLAMIHAQNVGALLECTNHVIIIPCNVGAQPFGAE